MSRRRGATTRRRERGYRIQAVGGGGGGGGEGGKDRGREPQRVDEQGARYTALLVRSLLCTGSCRPCCVVGLLVATTGRERREGASGERPSVPAW